MIQKVALRLRDKQPFQIEKQQSRMTTFTGTEEKKPSKKILKERRLKRRLSKLAGLKETLRNISAGGSDASKFKHKGLPRTPGKVSDKRLKGLMDMSADAGMNPRQTFPDIFNIDVGEDVKADPRLKNIVAGRALLRKKGRRGTSFARLQKLAQETPSVRDVKVNPNDGREIANGFDRLKHTPNDPKVKSAYSDFIKETNTQFKGLQDKGFKFSQAPVGGDAYPSSNAMNKDIARKQLRYFPTSRGFGRNADKFKDHPLLAKSPFKDAQGNIMTNNDVFRAVHDVNGHNFGEAADFSFAGEEQAFRTHQQFYSKNAQKALFTETAGQANWGTFSREFGARNRRDPSNMVFSEQKAGLFPDKIINKRFHI